MYFRPFDRAKFAIERWLVRGPLHRVALAALLVVMISMVGGIIVLIWGKGFGGFGEASWWAFLRLSDPGYLGDDVGVLNRTVSTALTILGYVVFLGALVAIMTQGLGAWMQRLESGLTPVVREGHVLILGWTSRTDSIIRELLLSEGRTQRFLDRRGVQGLQIVLLAERVTATFAQNLRDAVGPIWDEHRVTIRSGSPLQPEHLVRVAAAHASVILIPGADFIRGSVQSDVQTIKVLLSLAALASAQERAPRVVAEIFEAKKVHLARKAYPAESKILASDGVISRLLAQNVRHPGLSRVYDELLSHEEGNEIYIREPEELTGLEIEELHRYFPGAVLMGLVRPSNDDFDPILNPPSGTRLASGDRLVLLAPSYDDSKPSRSPVRPRFERGTRPPSESSGTEVVRRVLVLGWNHRVPALAAEFGTYEDERYEMQVVSKVPISDREELLKRGPKPSPSVTLTHVEVDFTDPEEMKALGPGTKDSVVFMGADWTDSAEEADARTLMGSLMIDEPVREGGRRPTVIMELLDPDNASLVSRSRGELIISPLFLSHLLTQIALRAELQSVFDELFAMGGVEITFRPVALYTQSRQFSFEELEQAASAVGETALGVRTRSTGSVELNPPKTEAWDDPSNHDLVTLVTT